MLSRSQHFVGWVWVLGFDAGAFNCEVYDSGSFYVLPASSSLFQSEFPSPESPETNPVFRINLRVISWHTLPIHIYIPKQRLPSRLSSLASRCLPSLSIWMKFPYAETPTSSAFED